MRSSSIHIIYCAHQWQCVHTVTWYKMTQQPRQHDIRKWFSNNSSYYDSESCCHAKVWLIAVLCKSKWKWHWGCSSVNKCVLVKSRVESYLHLHNATYVHVCVYHVWQDATLSLLSLKALSRPTSAEVTTSKVSWLWYTYCKICVVILRGILMQKLLLQPMKCLLHVIVHNFYYLYAGAYWAGVPSAIWWLPDHQQFPWWLNSYLGLSGP